MSEVREEMLARLQSERNGTEEPNTAPQEPVEGDPEDGGEVGTHDTDDTDETLDPEDGADSGDPDDGEDSDEDYSAYKEKYEALEKEFSRVTAHRKEIESRLDNAQTQLVTGLQDLEARSQEVEQVAEFYAGQAAQQLQRLQQVNPSQLSQEQFAQWQQAMGQAQFAVNQQQQTLQQIREQNLMAREQFKKKQAQVSRERLSVRMPDWGREKYQQLAEVAGEYGYTPEEFAEVVDHRMFLLLADVAASKDAAKVVENRVKDAKTNPPKRRAAREPDRNGKGQFTNAKKRFLESKPGTKGSFAAMKAAELRAERQK